MRRVWVTRTQPGAARLACAIRDAGFEAVERPVLEIVPTLDQAPAGPFDGAVFVSEQAASFAAELDLESAAIVVAIGQATQKALSQHALEAAIVERSSDALIERWRESEALRALSRVVLVKGEGGRATLPLALEEYSVLVVWDAYRRAAKIVASPPALDAIVCSSGDGVRAMAKADKGQHQQLPVIVPSARVAAIALALGYEDTHISDGAIAGAVVACLGELAQRKGDG